MRTKVKGPNHLEVEDLKAAWLDFKLGENKQAREQLILHYQPLVQAVARRLGGTLPAHIDDEDLISYGLFGLMDAMEKFDLDREIKFETYASTRIRGAIIDELRTIDWIPRSVRAQTRDITQTTMALETKLQRPPTDEEIATAIGITMTEYHKHKGQQNFIHMVALDAYINPAGDTDSDFSILNQLQDNRTQSPDLAFEAEEIKLSLANAVSVLPEREAVVLTLYYYEGLTLAEIGEALHVTESRICQMHTRAMAQVRAILAVA